MLFLEFTPTILSAILEDYIWYVNKSDKNAYSLKTNISPKTYTFLPQSGPKTWSMEKRMVWKLIVLFY